MNAAFKPTGTPPAETLPRVAAGRPLRRPRRSADRGRPRRRPPQVNGELAALKGAFVAAAGRAASAGRADRRGRRPLSSAATDKLWGVGAYAGLAASIARDDPAWAKFEADIRARSSQIAAESLFFTLELNELEDAEIEAALEAASGGGALAAVAAARAAVAAARADADLERMLLDRAPGGRQLGAALRRDAGAPDGPRPAARA